MCEYDAFNDLDLIIIMIKMCLMKINKKEYQLNLCRNYYKRME